MDRPLPQYVSRATLAALLDMGVRTLDDYCDKNIIPKPYKIGTLKRWHWAEVEKKIANQPLINLNERDPFDEGVNRVAAQEGHD